MLAGLERREDAWVHVDGEVLLRHDLVVPGLDGTVDPVPEWLANDGVDDVGQVASGQLLYLSRLDRQRQCYGRPVP